MGTKKKADAPEAAAKAALATGRLKPADMVKVTEQRVEVIKQAPGYAGNQDVQKAVTGWSTASDAVSKTDQMIQAARLALVALLATQQKNVAAWHRALGVVLAAISQAAGGSAEAIKQWGFATAAKTLVVDTNDAPAQLRAGYDKQLDLFFRWKAVKGSRGYFVQIGDGTQQGWGPLLPSPKARYAPTGLAPGQKIAVRVAVQRKSGMSAWSDPLSITVR